MNKCFNGLSTVNIELTSRCNKNCWMCGRRKIDRDYPNIALNYGDMDFKLVKSISEQLPDKILIQFHNNGEPLLYPKFGDAISLFSKNIKCIDTNAKLIVDKSDEIINKLDTMTISIFQDDPEQDEQYECVKQFIDLRGDKKPNLIYRCLGKVDIKRWSELPGIVATRILHNPLGSFKYEKNPTVPEVGICLDILNHLVIDRFGRVSPCVRFDPKRIGVIGDLNKQTLLEIWNGPERKKWVEYHKQGKRNKIALCSYCEFWGVPTGY